MASGEVFNSREKKTTIRPLTAAYQASTADSQVCWYKSCATVGGGCIIPSCETYIRSCEKSLASGICY